ncbi:hypothetical protein MY04_1401 [Flammeovirga sp. MY04]|uniref:hypothetical protein n=1 Tax=Flammeovirga sp. MY04 TaxID=1191459 RepID=UPI0008061E86|nr:hypothetical protein [Flammeovirga sp. MY04]ANQ48777.1 hypothetical protein MY04_1401 [Flammeovirga sp. MY04]
MSQRRKGFQDKKNVVTCKKYKWQHLIIYGFRLEKSKCPICKKHPEYTDKERMFIDLGLGFIFASIFVTLPIVFDKMGLILGQLGSLLIVLALVLSIRSYFNNSFPKKKK